MELEVLCLNGEGFRLRLSESTLGREVREMIAEKLPAKAGTCLMVTHQGSQLLLNKTLGEQGVCGSLSCTRVPGSIYDAWCFLQGIEVPEQEFALEGVTQVRGIRSLEQLQHLPISSVQSLTFHDNFDQSLQSIGWPNSLETLVFGYDFNQSLEGVSFPSSLQSLTFGESFNQSLEGVDLPSRLQLWPLVESSSIAWRGLYCQAICKA